MSTLPGLLLERATATPNAVALRFYRRGKWNEVTFAALRDKSAAIGTGLASAGVGAGDVVAVLCADGPVSLAAELGAQGIGSFAQVLDPELDAAAVKSALVASGAKAVIAGDQEQFDKVDEQRDELGAVGVLVVDAIRGLRHLEMANRSDRDRTMTLAQLESRGSTGWETTARSVAASAPARVLADGRRVSHEALLSAAERLATSTSMTSRDVLYSLHPLSNPTEHAVVVAGVLARGTTAHFGQQGIAEAGVRQVAPSIIHATPLWLAAINGDVEAQIPRARLAKAQALRAGFERKAPRGEVRRGRRVEPTLLAGIAAAALVLVFLLSSTKMNDFARLGVCVAIVTAVGELLVINGQAVAGPLRRRFGLHNARAVLASGPLPEGGTTLLGAIDVPLVSVNAEV